MKIAAISLCCVCCLFLSTPSMAADAPPAPLAVADLELTSAPCRAEKGLFPLDEAIFLSSCCETCQLNYEICIGIYCFPEQVISCEPICNRGFEVCKANCPGGCS
jgi:hypothetical protein